MEKFTKGPWSPHGGLVYATKKGDDVVVAATGSGNPVLEANAHLIAAAPEMYKMLERHLAAWSNLYPSDISDIDDMHKSEFEAVHKFISKTKELLAKARGEQ